MVPICLELRKLIGCLKTLLTTLKQKQKQIKLKRSSELIRNIKEQNRKFINVPYKIDNIHSSKQISQTEMIDNQRKNHLKKQNKNVRSIYSL